LVFYLSNQTKANKSKQKQTEANKNKQTNKQTNKQKTIPGVSSSTMETRQHKFGKQCV